MGGRASPWAEEDDVAEPFHSRPAPGSSLLGGMTARRTTRALREIEELLARAPSLRELPADALTTAAKQHGVDLARQIPTQRKHLYRRFLEHCLVDHAVSAEESADLERLQQLLCLDDAQAGEVHAQVAQAVYGQAIDQVLQDQRLDLEEEAFLQRLRKELALRDDVAQQLQTEGAQRARVRFLEKTSVHDNLLLAERQRVIELRAESPSGLEDAVRSAIAQAEAVPEARRFEVTQLRVERERGGLRWHVVVRSQLERPGDSEG
jgi:hypothetical protein